jgi:DNA polymerase
VRAPGTVPPPALPPELSALRDEVAVCEACPLYLGRTQTVFGSGAVDDVQWMVIGEAPGGHDDRVGLPFQGRAGELLHAMLRAVGIGPDASVFYTNLVKCQPRGSRNPTPEEIAACRPYLLRQITVLKPHRILALGHLAAQSLLQNPLDLEQLRGQVHWLDVDGATRVPVVATYHPAWLLLRGRAKADAWRDLNLARSV